MTQYKGHPEFFGLSVANWHSQSLTGGTIANVLKWSGYSITGSFVPRRTLNPAATSANEVMQALCTVVMDLLGKRENNY